MDTLLFVKEFIRPSVDQHSLPDDSTVQWMLHPFKRPTTHFSFPSQPDPSRANHVSSDADAHTSYPKSKSSSDASVSHIKSNAHGRYKSSTAIPCKTYLRSCSGETRSNVDCARADIPDTSGPWNGEKRVLRKQKNMTVSFDLPTTPKVQHNDVLVNLTLDTSNRSNQTDTFIPSSNHGNGNRGNSGNEEPASPRQVVMVPLLKQQSSETVSSSPLDDLDLIDIILRDNVHRELRSVLTSRAPLPSDGPTAPLLSPVTEDDNEMEHVLGNHVARVLTFAGDILEEMRVKSEVLLPITGAKAHVYCVYPNPDLVYDTYRIADQFDFLSRSYLSGNDALMRFEGARCGLVFVNYIFSDNISCDILKLIPIPKVKFVAFLDAGKKDLTLECFATDSLKPLLFDVC